MQVAWLMKTEAQTALRGQTNTTNTTHVQTHAVNGNQEVICYGTQRSAHVSYVKANKLFMFAETRPTLVFLPRPYFWKPTAQCFGPTINPTCWFDILGDFGDVGLSAQKKIKLYAQEFEMLSSGQKRDIQMLLQ